MEDEKIKVLVIEDNPGDAFLIKFYLEESGVQHYEYHHTDFLSSGIEMLNQKPFDVVLLDLNLPDSVGLETLEKIQEHVRDSVIIVLTGLTDEELGVETVKRGAQDFLVKGQFDGRVLNSSIRYALERSKLNKKMDDFEYNITVFKNRFDDLQDLLNAGYWEFDVANNELYVSNFMKKAFIKSDKPKYALEDIINIASPQDALRLKSFLQTAIDNEKQNQIEFDSKENEKLTLWCKYRINGTTKKLIGIIIKAV